MASTDIRQFLFYFKYLWSPADFTNLQLWLQETIGGTSEGISGLTALLSGLCVTPGGGTTINVASGIALGNSQLMVQGITQNLAVNIDPSNPRKSLVVLRPTITNMTNIPQPDNPNNLVPLHQKFTFTLMIIDGTPSATPVYPAAQSGDCVIMGLSLGAAISTITQAMLDRMPISAQRKDVHHYRKELGTYFASAIDEHIDFDVTASGSTVLMPPAATVAGQDYWIVKVDASTNALTVSGTENFSGQPTVLITDQWQMLHLRSIGLEWRLL